ncbi:hypothetical protein, partial [Mycobacterium timonense]
DLQTRKRLRLDVVAELGVLAEDLADVIATAWTDPATQKRLRGFLDDAAEPIDAALQQRNLR